MLGYSAPIFICFFSLALLVAYLSSRANKSVQRLSAGLITLSISAFYGFRDSDIGVDTSEYINRFLNTTFTEDYLFSMLSIASHSIGLSPSFYLFLISLLTSTFLLLAIKNFTGSYAKASFFLIIIAILPYGIMSYINIVRQGLAVSVILYGISLIYIGKARLGYFVNFLSFFVHKTTALIYAASIIIKKLRQYKHGTLLTILLATALFILSSFIPHFISFIDPSFGDRYAEYAGEDSSESPYLIYAKIAWALLHLVILSKLNSSKALFNPLYTYYISIIAIAVLLVSNPLVSSRILSSIDFILPVIYASYSGGNRSMRNVGIFLLLLYAVISPFIFQMYSINFNYIT